MKLLLADDHAMFRTAVADGLEAMIGTGTEVLEADSYDAAHALLQNNPDVDVVLLDLLMPGFANFDGLGVLVRDFPAVPVVVLSGSESRENVTRALSLGAMGYIPKRYSNDVLIGALRLVLSGGLYVPPAVLPLSSDPATPKPTPQATSPAATIRPEDLGLTPRQSEVLALVLQGLPNKLICRRLNLAEPTVKVHMQAVLRALDAQNRVQAVIEASRRGLTIDALMARAKRKPDGAAD